MSITSTELKNNLGKYLLLSAKEDVFITKNGKVVAKLTNPHQDRVEVAKSLFGILPKDADLNEAVTNLIYHFKRIFYCTYRFTAIFPITINTATRTILIPLYNFFIKKTYRAYHASTSIRCIVLSTLYGLFKPQS